MGIEAIGGPRVPFLPGRKDSRVYPPEGRLPLYDKSACCIVKARRLCLLTSYISSAAVISWIRCHQIAAASCNSTDICCQRMPPPADLVASTASNRARVSSATELQSM